MGFAVTATHVIFAIALLSAGTFAASAYWRVGADVEEARRVSGDRTSEVAHTVIAINGSPAPSWASGPQRFTFYVKNNGSTVLNVSQFVFIVDGAYNASLDSGYPSVIGNASSKLLMPGDTMEVRLRPIAASPTHLRVVAGNGVSAYWRA